MKKMLLSLLALGIFIGVIGYFTGNNFKKASKEAELVVAQTPLPTKAVNIGGVSIDVAVVDTQAERERGLSGTESLDANSGMLFVFPEPQKATFWMKGMNYDLDIIWIQDGRVIGINRSVSAQKGAPESELKLYPSPDIVDYVLEVNAGFSDQKGIQTGDTVELNLGS